MYTRSNEVFAQPDIKHSGQRNSADFRPTVFLLPWIHFSTVILPDFFRTPIPQINRRDAQREWAERLGLSQK